MSPLKRKAKPDDSTHFAARAKECLVGLAVGNALGRSAAGKIFQAPAFPELAIGPVTRPSRELGLGVAWAATLAELLRAGAGYDPEAAVRAYVAIEDRLRRLDLPRQESLALVREGLHFSLAAREAWNRSRRALADSGALLRAVPLGVRFAGSPEARLAACLSDSATTHFDPRCQLASASVAGAIAYALSASPRPTPTKVFDGAKRDLKLAASLLARNCPDVVREVQAALEALSEDLSLAGRPDPLLWGPEFHLHRSGSLVRLAFRLAFWELAHAPSLESAVLDAVNRGGDTEAHGALTGALWGALQGEGAVPRHWSEVLSGNPAVHSLLQILPA